MSLESVLTIVAIILAPIVALQVSKKLAKNSEKRDRREHVFRTLMATRASTLAPAHVEALNMIDVTFYGSDKKSKKVVDACKTYLDHLNTTDMAPEVWGPKREELFVILLSKMANSLGYDFETTAIKKTSYFPSGYGDTELDLLAIRKSLRSLLEGHGWINVVAHPATWLTENGETTVAEPLSQPAAQPEWPPQD